MKKEIYYDWKKLNLSKLLSAKNYDLSKFIAGIRKCYEIDFIAKKGSKKYYIQVSNDISSLETKTREIRPFIALNDSFQKIIVINRPLEESLDSNGFVIIGIADFLLRFIK